MLVRRDVFGLQRGKLREASVRHSDTWVDYLKLFLDACLDRARRFLVCIDGFREEGPFLLRILFSTPYLVGRI